MTANFPVLGSPVTGFIHEIIPVSMPELVPRSEQKRGLCFFFFLCFSFIERAQLIRARSRHRAAFPIWIVQNFRCSFADARGARCYVLNLIFFYATL